MSHAVVGSRKEPAKKAVDGRSRARASEPRGGFTSRSFFFLDTHGIPNILTENWTCADLAARGLVALLSFLLTTGSRNIECWECKNRLPRERQTATRRVTRRFQALPLTLNERESIPSSLKGGLFPERVLAFLGDTAHNSVPNARECNLIPLAFC